MRVSIIDLGTNTFHLMIAENGNVLHKESVAVKLGQGGINSNLITEDAIARALQTLIKFKETIDTFLCGKTLAFGTSAIRNAKNSGAFVSLVLEKTGINITVIDGDQEAKLIYEGVRKAVDVTENSLIIDIGGGSVEFIICDTEKVLWKKSIEIGGQRLMEKFMKSDPISPENINLLNDYLRNQLLPLANAIHQYHPKVLIGSSGSFDTLNDMYQIKTTGALPDETIVGFNYPLESFWEAYEDLVFSDKNERMAIPGMISLRVEMIVVAVILIKHIIENFGIKEIKISNYALKEGALKQL